MNVKLAAAAVAMAMVMMSVPALAMLPSDDVFADSGSTYAVGLVEGTPYDYTPTFNLSNVTVELSGSAASWLSVSGNTISGIAPPVSQYGGTDSYELTIEASTTQPTQVAYQHILFTVYDTLVASVMEPVVKTYVGGHVMIPVDVNYMDGVTYEAPGLPSGLNIDNNTGEINGVPVYSGTTVIDVTVRHLASGQTANCSVTFQVSEAITITSGSDIYMVNGMEIVTDPTSPDFYRLMCNIDGVTFEMSGAVTGVQINSDGTFSGTPTSMGDIPVTITITETETGQTYDFEMSMHIVSKLSFDSVPTGGIIVSGA